MKRKKETKRMKKRKRKLTKKKLRQKNQEKQPGKERRLIAEDVKWNFWLKQYNGMLLPRHDRRDNSERCFNDVMKKKM